MLRFALEESVPFTNNQAERDIRPAKVKQNMATSFRTAAGAQHYASIQAFIATVRKNHIPLFPELTTLFQDPHYCLELPDTS